MLVKICGLQDAESASVAIDSGADLLGVILVPNRKRTVAKEECLRISELVHKAREGKKCKHAGDLREELKQVSDAREWTQASASFLKENGPFLVGVVRNQSIQEINSFIEEYGVNLIQLHGSEPKEASFISQINAPVIARFVPQNQLKLNVDKSFILPLFDGEAGGEGIVLNWDELGEWHEAEGHNFVLAGGLTPENVGEAVRVNGVVGIDVSGGVETDGVKDADKIRKFVRAAKAEN